MKSRCIALILACAACGCTKQLVAEVADVALADADAAIVDAASDVADVPAPEVDAQAAEVADATPDVPPPDAVSAIPDAAPADVDAQSPDAATTDAGLCINVRGGCEDVCALPADPCTPGPYHPGDWCCPWPFQGKPLAAGTICLDPFDAPAPRTCDSSGACLPAAATAVTACDDGNPCTADILSADNTSCKHAAMPDYVPCKPGWDTFCFGGQCQGIVSTYSSYPSCTVTADCAASLPANSCAALFGCLSLYSMCGESGGGCIGLGETACPPPADTCKRAACQPTPVTNGWSAVCATSDAPDGALCDDGIAGNGPDVCKGGVCSGK